MELQDTQSTWTHLSTGQLGSVLGIKQTSPGGYPQIALTRNRNRGAPARQTPLPATVILLSARIVARRTGTHRISIWTSRRFAQHWMPYCIYRASWIILNGVAFLTYTSFVPSPSRTNEPPLSFVETPFPLPTRILAKTLHWLPVTPFGIWSTLTTNASFLLLFLRSELSSSLAHRKSVFEYRGRIASWVGVGLCSNLDH